jgi:glucose-1-phosphate adenylyltransferase
VGHGRTHRGRQPVRTDEASRLGILKRDKDCRVPLRRAKVPTLAEMVSRDDPAKPFLGSMGIYCSMPDL